MIENFQWNCMTMSHCIKRRFKNHGVSKPKEKLSAGWETNYVSMNLHHQEEYLALFWYLSNVYLKYQKKKHLLKNNAASINWESISDMIVDLQHLCGDGKFCVVKINSCKFHRLLDFHHFIDYYFDQLNKVWFSSFL